MKRTLTKVVIAYISMVVCFFLLVYSACIIPHKSIDHNIEESLNILYEEGNFPKLCDNIMWKKDNMTDGTMFSIAVSGYDVSPLCESITNPWSFNGYETPTSKYGLDALHSQDGSVPRQSYGRYWHGYQLPLRLLSIFFNIREIRILNAILLYGLLLITGYLIYRNFGLTIGIGWLVSFIAVGFPVVPLSMQYVACYYITFISVILICAFSNLRNNPIFYFILGGCTSFFDFLTVPLLPIGITLIITLLFSIKNFQRKDLILLFLFWGLGYVGIWITKWIILAAYSYNNYAVTSTLIETGGRHLIFKFLPEGFSHEHFISTVVLLFSTLLFTLFIYLYRKKYNKKYISTLFAISIIPFVWYFVLIGHTVLHSWFVYRNLTVTVLCCWLMLFYSKYSSKIKTRSIT